MEATSEAGRINTCGQIMTHASVVLARSLAGNLLAIGCCGGCGSAVLCCGARARCAGVARRDRRQQIYGVVRCCRGA
eukprot:15433096-Alexandrium_andersonii.AAC.1